MILAIITIGLISLIGCTAYLTIRAINDIMSIEEKVKLIERHIEEVEKQVIKTAQQFDGIQKDMDAVAQVAWNASNKATVNGKKLEKLQTYEIS